MKHHKRFPIAMLLTSILIVFGLSACRRQQLTPDRFVGKLVINGPCGNYAIQLISGKIDPSKIMATWASGY